MLCFATTVINDLCFKEKNLCCQCAAFMLFIFFLTSNIKNRNFMCWINIPLGGTSHILFSSTCSINTFLCLFLLFLFYCVILLFLQCQLSSFLLIFLHLSSKTCLVFLIGSLYPLPSPLLPLWSFNSLLSSQNSEEFCNPRTCLCSSLQLIEDFVVFRWERAGILSFI